MNLEKNYLREDYLLLFSLKLLKGYFRNTLANCSVRMFRIRQLLLPQESQVLFWANLHIRHFSSKGRAHAHPEPLGLPIHAAAMFVHNAGLMDLHCLFCLLLLTLPEIHSAPAIRPFEF